jgi:DNA polymerase-3 subunit gamma/tau
LSFLVTARKWRPKTFAEVVGQEGVCRTLQNALRAGRVAHAYIFSGPRGIGKTTTARLLAKAINCVKGPTPEPCNQCIPCQEIPEGRSLDTLEIDGASNRGVNEIRNLRENIRFNPVGCRKRIYIIDEVHMLTIEAFNALLKTLEEPPEHALFIFATTEINRVPATILSRCQRFDFRRISSSEITAHLKFICEQEGIKADEEALELLARRADGAMRDAQSLLDQMATFAPEGISADQVRSALGIVPEELFFRSSSLVLDRRPADVFPIVEEIDGKGYSPREFLRGLSDHFLNILKARDPRASAYIEAPAEIRRHYEDQAGRFETNDLLRILAILQDAFTDIRLHPQPRLKLELTLLRLAALERTAQIEDLLIQLKGGAPTVGNPSDDPPTGTESAPRYANRPAAPKPIVAERPPPTPEAAPPAVNGAPLDFDYIRANWLDIVDRICEGKLALACQLKLARPEVLEGDVIVASFGADLHDVQLDRLHKIAYSGGFDRGMIATFGAPLRFRFQRHEAHRSDAGTESATVDDPLEQELVRVLGARRLA